jgi:hypothetical protein
MDPEDGTDQDPGRIPHVPHTPHPLAEWRHEYQSIDRDDRLVVRTVLWVIVGLMLLAFVNWWALT